MTNWVNRFMGSIRAGTAAFRNEYMNGNPAMSLSRGGRWDVYGRPAVRAMRYELFWSLYECNTFEECLRNWEETLKTTRSVYKSIRTIHSVGYRIGQFWGSHVFAGSLDPLAGDGELIRSALPLVSISDPVRAAIAKVWEDSNFSTFKDVIPLYGSILGDCGIAVVDDPIRKQVRLKVIHPGWIKWLDRNDAGDTTGYILSYQRPNPDFVPSMASLTSVNDTIPTCEYREIAKLLPSGRVEYTTLKDGAEFDWRGVDTGMGGSPTWEVDYRGILPFYCFHHNQTTMTWGMSELLPAFPKEIEINDNRSLLGDQIRKAVSAPHLLAGVRKPAATLTPGGATATTDNPNPDRDESSFLFADLGATATQLYSDLDISGVSGHTGKMHSEIIEDYPELQVGMITDGRTSGRAVREARRAAEIKVQTRRPAYDKTLTMAQSAAVWIGAIRGYDGFEGVPSDDFANPGLQHRIAHRPVFQPDPLDRIEQDTAFWTMAQTAVAAGMPLETILRREGWPESDIAAVVKHREDQQAAAEAAKAQTNFGVKGGNKTEGQKAQSGD